MVHHTSDEEHANLIYAFPISVNQETRLIVLLGKSLPRIVEDFQKEMSVQASIVNLGLDPSLYDNESLREIVGLGDRLMAVKQVRLRDKGISVMALPLYAGTVSSHTMIVALKRDISELIRTEDGYNRTMLYSTVSALLIIVLVLLVVQRSIFSGLNYAIEVLQ